VISLLHRGNNDLFSLKSIKSKLIVRRPTKKFTRFATMRSLRTVAAHVFIVRSWLPWIYSRLRRQLLIPLLVKLWPRQPPVQRYQNRQASLGLPTGIAAKIGHVIPCRWISIYWPITFQTTFSWQISSRKTLAICCSLLLSSCNCSATPKRGKEASDAIKWTENNIQKKWNKNERVLQ